MQSRCCWPPESAPPGSSRRSRTSRHSPARVQRLLDQRVLVVALMRVSFRPAEHVLADAHRRERIGLLEHHADPGAAPVGARMSALVDVLAVEQDLAVERGTGHQLVHPVEQSEERRLAAARRTDERGDLTGRHAGDRRLRAPVVAEPRARIAGLERGRARRWAADQLGSTRRPVVARTRVDVRVATGWVSPLARRQAPAEVVGSARRRDLGPAEPRVGRRW